jgi:type IV pilus assembly protein PilC
MPDFTYQAINTKGNTTNGTVEATNRAAAVETLTRQKLRPISIKEKSSKLNFSLKSIFKSRIKTDTLVVFTRQFAAMTGAGVPLLRSLVALQTHTDNEAMRIVLGAVAKDVQSGSTLTDALAKHPEAFNDIYVNMVRAGEAAGILDEILTRLAIQQEKNATIRKKIKSAMTYPFILLFITVVSFFGLMLFVVPQIGKIVKDLSSPGTELPILTQIMLGISAFMQQFWYIIIVAAALGVFALRRYLRTPQGKRAFHSLVLRIPVLKDIIVKVSNARFARTFSALLGAGVSVIEALKVTGRAIGNVKYEDEITRAIDSVKNGKQLSEALGNSPLFPAIVSQMLAVGEETGQTDTILIKVADFYDEEVDAVINGLSSIIEPVMIVVMGAMVGLIAASVMEPITSLAHNIH